MNYDFIFPKILTEVSLAGIGTAAFRIKAGCQGFVEPDLFTLLYKTQKNGYER